METNRNCIIIHGCVLSKELAMNPETRTYDKHWIPWIKKELIQKGIKTETPLMPNPWEPIYSDYKKEFEKCLINENTILIGHSCGCAFLVRWLGEAKIKVDKLVLVAPWKIAYGEGKMRQIKQDFYEFPIDETIKDRVREIIMFTSDNEADDGKKSLNIYHASLGGKIVELKGMRHYTQRDMGTTEFPELLTVILNEATAKFN